MLNQSEVHTKVAGHVYSTEIFRLVEGELEAGGVKIGNLHVAIVVLYQFTTLLQGCSHSFQIARKLL